MAKEECSTGGKGKLKKKIRKDSDQTRMKKSISARVAQDRKKAN